MNSSFQKYGLLTIKVLLTLAFVAAGLAKLAGADMMVQTFDAVGIGQWFRYVTGVIEITGAALLWVRGCEFYGAGLLACTMAGAVLSHLLIIGPSAIPAVILGTLSLVVAYAHRDQLAGLHH